MLDHQDRLRKPLEAILEALRRNQILLVRTERATPKRHLYVRHERAAVVEVAPTYPMDQLVAALYAVLLLERLEYVGCG